MEAGFLRTTALHRFCTNDDRLLGLEQTRMTAITTHGVRLLDEERILVVWWRRWWADDDRSLFLDLLSYRVTTQSPLLLFVLHCRVGVVGQWTAGGLWTVWSELGIHAVASEVVLETVGVDFGQEGHVDGEEFACGFLGNLCALPIRCGAEKRSNYSLIG